MTAKTKKQVVLSKLDDETFGKLLGAIEGLLHRIQSLEKSRTELRERLATAEHALAAVDPGFTTTCYEAATRDLARKRVENSIEAAARIDAIREAEAQRARDAHGVPVDV